MWVGSRGGTEEGVGEVREGGGCRSRGDGLDRIALYCLLNANASGLQVRIFCSARLYLPTLCVCPRVF